jgi:hypothetical protein
MFRTLRNCTALFLLSLLLVGAGTQQNDGIPWWVWLIGISVVLLLVFIVVVALAWRDTGRPRDGR